MAQHNTKIILSTQNIIFLRFPLTYILINLNQTLISPPPVLKLETTKSHDFLLHTQVHSCILLRKAEQEAGLQTWISCLPEASVLWHHPESSEPFVYLRYIKIFEHLFRNIKRSFYQGNEGNTLNLKEM